MLSAIPSILLADDDPEDRQLFLDEFVCQNPGVMLRQFDGGLPLLQYLHVCPVEQLPAVVVLDYDMPDITGPQVLLRLSGDGGYNDIVKIMWSSARLPEDVDACKRLGAALFLQKPTTEEELKRSIRQLSAVFRMAYQVVC